MPTNEELEKHTATAKSNNDEMIDVSAFNNTSDTDSDEENCPSDSEI